MQQFFMIVSREVVVILGFALHYLVHIEGNR